MSCESLPRNNACDPLHSVTVDQTLGRLVDVKA